MAISSASGSSSGPRPNLLEQMRLVMERRHYARSTIRAYIAWVKRFVLFHRKRHPRNMGGVEIRQYLSHLASRARVSASTQNQALSAILFLYNHVLEIELPRIDSVERAKNHVRLPVVLTPEEARAILGEMSGVQRLIAALLYGSGLRLLEGLRLRGKDIDFARYQIAVRDTKGHVDRVTILPRSLEPLLRKHLRGVKAQHERDRANGAGFVELPHALARKYPNASHEWPWQWVFPATRTYVDRRTGERRRHHFHESAVQREVKEARRRTGITKPATSHTFRHSFATHIVQSGHDVRILKKLLGHKDLKTTMIYLHIAGRELQYVRSPLDEPVGTPPRFPTA